MGAFAVPQPSPGAGQRSRRDGERDGGTPDGRKRGAIAGTQPQAGNRTLGEVDRDGRRPGGVGAMRGPLDDGGLGRRRNSVWGRRRGERGQRDRGGCSGAGGRENAGGFMPLVVARTLAPAIDG
jgi:hypothetical protein